MFSQRMIRMWGDWYVNLLDLIISQHIHIWKHYLVYHKYIQFLSPIKCFYLSTIKYFSFLTKKKNLSRGQNLSLCLSYLQIPHSNKINHLNSAFEYEREKKKPSVLVAMVTRKALWMWICRLHKVKSKNSDILSTDKHSATTAAHLQTSMNSMKVDSGIH